MEGLVESKPCTCLGDLVRQVPLDDEGHDLLGCRSAFDLMPTWNLPKPDPWEPIIQVRIYEPKGGTLTLAMLSQLQNPKVSQCGTPFYTFLYRPPLGI